MHALRELGVIDRVRRKYLITERWFVTFDLRRDFRVGQKVKLHWLRRAADRLARAPSFSDDERFSYYVFSGSAEVTRAIDREYFEFLRRAIALVEAQRDRRIATPRAMCRAGK